MADKLEKLVYEYAENVLEAVIYSFKSYDLDLEWVPVWGSNVDPITVREDWDPATSYAREFKCEIEIEGLNSELLSEIKGPDFRAFDRFIEDTVKSYSANNKSFSMDNLFVDTSIDDDPAPKYKADEALWVIINFWLGYNE